jgi:hypothetical protein
MKQKFETPISARLILSAIYKLAALVAISGLLTLNLSCSQGLKYALNAEGKRPKPIIAVDNVVAWPVMTKMNDGTIVIFIHNDSTHFKGPSDVECWASTDNGLNWEHRSTPSPRDTETAGRGSIGAGLVSNGDLVLITTGWSHPDSSGHGTLLNLLVYRSSDGGYTWDINESGFPDKWPEAGFHEASPKGEMPPFGDIIQGADGNLRAALYGWNPGAVFVYRSTDDGWTWGDAKVINPDKVIHEPAIFHLGSGKWLCAARNSKRTDPTGMDLYRSEDDANTWSYEGGLTPTKRHPGHFLRLNDGRIVLTYGNRWEKRGSKIPRGVQVKVSKDEGKTWSKPVRLVDFYNDGGYPTSTQLPDGEVLTAYYAQKIKGYDRYHLGVVIWDPEKTLD